jgi:putative inorganic carbon (HCO3(-)) transporter
MASIELKNNEPSPDVNYNEWLPLVFAAAALVVGGLLGLLVGIDFDMRYVVVAAITVVAVVVIVRRPDWGLYLLVAIIYTNFSQVAIRHYGLPSIAQVYIPFLLGVVGLRWLLFNERPKWWEQAVVLMGLWFILAFSALLYAENYGRAMNGVEDIVKNSIVALAVIGLMRRASTFRNVIWVMLLVGIFMGTINSYQFLTGTFDNDYWGFADTNTNRTVDGDASVIRISGSLGSNNFFAQIMLLLIPLALDRVLHEKRLALRLLAGWALVAVSMAVIFTYSRGGFLAVVAMFAVIFFVNPPRLHHIILLVVLAIGLSQVLPASYVSRVISLGEIFNQGEVEGIQLEDRSLRGRTSEVLAAWYMFLDHPVAGVGLGNYNHHYQDYSEEIGLDSRRTARSAHSLYLEIAAEKGIIGMVLFGVIVATMYSSLRKASQYFRKAELHDYHNMTYALAVGLFGYFVAAIFLHDAFPRYFWMFFGICLVLPHVAQFEYSLQKGNNETPANLMPSERQSV